MALRDLAAASIVCLLAATVFYASGNYAAEAAAFPRLISGLMFICGAAIFARSFFRSEAPLAVDWAMASRVAVVAVATIVYVFAFRYVGFVTSSIIFIPAICYYLGFRSLVTIAISTVVFIAAVYYAFTKLFGTQLPTDLILSAF